MPNQPFPIHPQMTAVAIRYRPTDIDPIAEAVLPSAPPVSNEEFTYAQYSASDAYRIPDGRIGRKGRRPQAEFGYTEQTGRVSDYGYDDPVPQRDITQAAANAVAMPGGVAFDPVATAVESITDYLVMSREIRAAALVFSAASYRAGLRSQLSGTSQWDDYDHSDPLGLLLDAIEEPLMRPNTLVLGHRTWTKLRRHPRLVQAVIGMPVTDGAITRQQLATLLELPNVLVGASRVNAARKGQADNYIRTWGPHAALLYINATAASQKKPTFAYTQPYSSGGPVRKARVVFDSTVGVEGAQVVTVTESMAEVACAPDCGFFFEDAVSS
jgi:hypothetical protein